jgi:hypothetical protein
LACLALFAYRGIGRCGFVNYDDVLFVAANPPVQGGLTVAGQAWAWTTFHAGAYQPLTWTSLQLDATVHGMDPAGFHATSLILHALNTALLFGFLCGSTGDPWRSALVAGLFAVHPLHVESVAWISERKGTLSTFFAFLALSAYWRHARRPRWQTYVLVALAQVLSLLAKPMLVTLPVLLLLLDWWPLARWQGSWQSATRLILEKVPLVLISVGFGLATVRAEDSASTLPSLDLVPWSLRVNNSLVASATYLGQTIWPARLAIYYPFLPVAAVRALAGAALLAGITGFLCWLKRPALVVGWLWFLITLLPVIGLVQVGDQSHADRYTYVPHVGLFIAMVWGFADLLDSLRASLPVRLGLATAVLIACTVLADRQVATWRNSITLWQHALEVSEPEPSWTVLNNLGGALATEEMRITPGLLHCRRARTAAVSKPRGTTCWPAPARCSKGLRKAPAYRGPRP